MAEIDAGDRLQADQENMFRDTADGDKVYRRVSAPALQAKLQEILDAVDGLEGFTDGLEGLLTSITSVLETIRDNADEIEGFVDGLEGFASAANALLTTIRDNADQVESLLTTLNSNTDTLETLVTATNALLTTIRDNADAVETLLTSANATLTDIENGIPESLGQKTMAESMPVVISSDQSPASLNNQSIGQQGAAVPGYATMIGADDGTNMQRLIVRTSAPINAAQGLVTRPMPFMPITFWVYGLNIAVASQKSFLSILNSTVGLKVMIHEMWAYNIRTAAVAGAAMVIEGRRITGHSAGTQLTTTPAAAGRIMLMDTTDILDAGVTVRTGGTMAGEDAFAFIKKIWSTDEFGAGAADAETTEHTAAQTVPFYQCRPDTKPITLNNGEGLHIRQNGTLTAGTFDFAMLCTAVT